MSALTMSYSSGLASNVNLLRYSGVAPRDRMNSSIGAFSDPKVLAAYGRTLAVSHVFGPSDKDSGLQGIIWYGRAITINSGQMRSSAVLQDATSLPQGDRQDSITERVTPMCSEDRRRLGLTSIRSLAPNGNAMRECLAPSFGGVQDTVTGQALMDSENRRRLGLTSIRSLAPLGEEMRECLSPSLCEIRDLSPGCTLMGSNMLSSQSCNELLSRATHRDTSPLSPSTRPAPGIRNLRNTICTTPVNSSQGTNTDEEAQRSWLRLPLGTQQSPRIRRQRSAMELRLRPEDSKETARELPRGSKHVMRRWSSALTLPTAQSGTKARSLSGSARSQSPSVVKDHMWQTLSDSEELDPTIPRLRGEGCAIGQKGKASLGISWRQLPQFSPAGQLHSTAEPSPSVEDIHDAIGMQSKKETVFSRRKPEMIEVLTHFAEAALVTPPHERDGHIAHDDSCSYFKKGNSSPFTKACARSPRVRLLSPVSALQPGHMVPIASSPLDDYGFAEKSGKARNRQCVQDLQDIQRQSRLFEPTLPSSKLQGMDSTITLSTNVSGVSTTTLSTASTTTVLKGSPPRVFRVASARRERPKWI